jgi:hypothetical protein
MTPTRPIVRLIAALGGLIGDGRYALRQLVAPLSSRDLAYAPDSLRLDDRVPSFGPDSVWDISRNRVESAGTAKITLQYKRMTAAGALEQLRLAKP